MHMQEKHTVHNVWHFDQFRTSQILISSQNYTHKHNFSVNQDGSEPAKIVDLSYNMIKSIKLYIIYWLHQPISSLATNEIPVIILTISYRNE